VNGLKWRGIMSKKEKLGLVGLLLIVIIMIYFLQSSEVEFWFEEKSEVQIFTKKLETPGDLLEVFDMGKIKININRSVSNYIIWADVYIDKEGEFRGLEETQENLEPIRTFIVNGDSGPHRSELLKEIELFTVENGKVLDLNQNEIFLTTIAKRDKVSIRTNRIFNYNEEYREAKEELGLSGSGPVMWSGASEFDIEASKRVPLYYLSSGGSGNNFLVAFNLMIIEEEGKVYNPRERSFKELPKDVDKVSEYYDELYEEENS